MRLLLTRQLFLSCAAAQLGPPPGPTSRAHPGAISGRAVRVRRDCGTDPVPPLVALPACRAERLEEGSSPQLECLGIRAALEVSSSEGRPARTVWASLDLVARQRQRAVSRQHTARSVAPSPSAAPAFTPSIRAVAVSR